MSEIKKYREPVTHDLKIYAEYFSAVCTGVKRAELRKNDRDYRAGDTLDLCEWDRDDESFTGEFISVTVTHVADVGEWMPGYVLLSIERALLALRERAEPVAYRYRFRPTREAAGKWILVDTLEEANPLPKYEIQPLYTAPPAPVAAGWIACSERLPKIGDEIFYYCEDDGIRDCGIVSSSNFTGRGDAELFVHAEGYDLRFGADITHWMPLPEAPTNN